GGALARRERRRIQTPIGRGDDAVVDLALARRAAAERRDLVARELAREREHGGEARLAGRWPQLLLDDDRRAGGERAYRVRDRSTERARQRGDRDRTGRREMRQHLAL